MDTKDILANIKKLLFGSDAFAAHTLADGSVIEVSALEVGADVTKDGAPALDGEYELADGSKIVVAAGKISAITPKEAEIEIEMSIHKLQDGTEVEISTLAEGGTVMIAGVPAVEGEYILEDGTVLKVDATGAIVSVSVAGIDPNAPLQMGALTKIMEKFAGGTPEERIANLETVSKAVMEYCFGWQIREQQVKQQADAAIAVYKQGFAASTTELAIEKKKVADLLEATQQLFTLVEKLGGEAAGDPPAKRKVVQSFGLTNDKRGSAIDRYAKAAQQALTN